MSAYRELLGNECIRINYSQAPDSVARGIEILAEEVRRAYA